MLDEGRACEDVVTQLLAVRAAVDRAAGEVVMAHVDECIARLPPEHVKEKVGRAVKMLGRIGS
jgi:DNA-binding FrmR family transcriptional regulator